MRAHLLAFALPALFVPALPHHAGGSTPDLKSQLLVTGLDQPVHVAARPGKTDPLFVVEQPGTVQVVSHGAIQAQPFLDLTAQVKYGGEGGLLSLAFHPDYAQNGHAYLYYNDLAGDTVLARFTAPVPASPVADPASESVILKIAQPFDKHNGGTLAFGLDGYLYLATGDGGGIHDPQGNAQSLGSLLGKVLRIDVDGGSPYAIPPDNPFVGVPGAREEIFALGLRNPWRGSIDAETGDLFLGDVGNLQREELNFVAAGANLGWDCIEGELCQSEPGCVCPDPGFVDPLLTYDHNIGCAIVGGPVYRGTLLPGLDGRVFLADYCVSRVWSYAWDGTALSDEVEHTSELSAGGPLGLLTSFGQDGKGEMYLTSFFPGALYKIVPADPVPDCDGDGTPDADEILAGSAFDVNGNGIPDDCELLLTADDFQSGQVATLEFIGASPGDLVAFLWTTRGIGGGLCFYDGAWCLSLLPMPGVNPIGVLTLETADAVGTASPSFVVPDFPNPQFVALQAVVFLFEASKVSNPIQKIIP